MFKGLFFSLIATFCWGSTFIIPRILLSFSSIEIALGRYCVYGLFSTLIFGFIYFKKLFKFPFHYWWKALILTLVGNIIYFASVTFAIQNSNPALTTLIIGIAPVTTAFYGNFKERIFHPSKFILPSLAIAAGLAVIHAEAFSSDLFGVRYLLGILSAFVTLISFTWYTVGNAKFLKENPSLNHFEWSSLNGIVTFFWVALVSSILLALTGGHYLERYGTLTKEVGLFLSLIGYLGIVCSWLSTSLWSTGTSLLPLSIGGQMSIFKTLFGLLFVYLYEQRLPTLLESAGVLLMLGAILYTVNFYITKRTALT